MVHEIALQGYEARAKGCLRRDALTLGTWDSYGVERLHVSAGAGWEGLAVTATFHPPGGQPVQLLADPDGMVDVPPEATERPTQGALGRIVFAGTADGVRRISTDLQYVVLPHACAAGTNSAPPSPGLAEQLLAQIAAIQAKAAQALDKAVNALRRVPDGGTAGQVLTKRSDADGDTVWGTPADGGSVPSMTDDDALELLAEAGMVAPAAAADGALYTDAEGRIYVL